MGCQEHQAWDAPLAACMRAEQAFSRHCSHPAVISNAPVRWQGVLVRRHAEKLLGR